MSDSGTTQWWKITVVLCWGYFTWLFSIISHFILLFYYNSVLSTDYIELFFFLCWLLFTIKKPPSWIFCIVLETRRSLCLWNMWYCDICAVEVKPCSGWLLVIIIVIWSTMRGGKDEQVSSSFSIYVGQMISYSSIWLWLWIVLQRNPSFLNSH